MHVYTRVLSKLVYTCKGSATQVRPLKNFRAWDSCMCLCTCASGTCTCDTHSLVNVCRKYKYPRHKYTNTCMSLKHGSFSGVLLVWPSPCMCTLAYLTHVCTHAWRGLFFLWVRSAVYDVGIRGSQPVEDPRTPYLWSKLTGFMGATVWLPWC